MVGSCQRLERLILDEIEHIVVVHFVKMQLSVVVYEADLQLP